MARLVEAIAWIAGILLLGAYFSLRAWSVQARDEGLEAMRQARQEHSSPAVELSVGQPDTSTWAPKRLAEYRESAARPETPQAVLRIPKLKLEVPIYEGTSDATLNRGAGRIAGTARTDSRAGNIGIAAHRDGFFRPLKDIAVGDTLVLETVDSTRRYQVTQLRIVEPNEVGVLAETSGSTITLVTCYPFYFVGSAPQRFIVTAQADEHGLASDFGD